MELTTTHTPHRPQIIPFPVLNEELLTKMPQKEIIPTPKSDQVFKNAEELKRLSKYPCNFDFDVYRQLELRFENDQPRGGVIFGTSNPFKLINTHPACQQCLYGFEMDTYGRGCIHDCAYCYSKVELTSHGYWNQPFPMPRDITTVWKTFYTVFETSKPHKWREILEKRVPLRIGSGSDGLMYIDRKYRVTYELLKLLKYYNYPYIIVTRSDLVAHDDYLEVMDPNLASIQLSIPSMNDDLIKKIEPGAPDATRRLKSIQKLTRSGFWTTVRLNPLFPMHADGYFTDPNISEEKKKLKFDFFDMDIVQAVAEHGGQSILAGFVRLSNMMMKNVHQACGVDLKPFFKKENRRSSNHYHYSIEEITAYYDRIHAKTKQHGVQFTTCYIGNEESYFWKHQNLWDNKKDCCNAQGRISGFNSDARKIDYSIRQKLSEIKMPANDIAGINQELGDIPKELLQQLVERSTGLSYAVKKDIHGN